MHQGRYPERDWDEGHEAPHHGGSRAEEPEWTYGVVPRRAWSRGGREWQPYGSRGQPLRDYDAGESPEQRPRASRTPGPSGSGGYSAAGRGGGQWDAEEQRYGRYGTGEVADVWSATYLETWVVPGPFSGIGPEGYRRSDERIQDDVCERLTRHGNLDASGIRVSVRDGEVTLDGSVDNRRAKRLAEDVAESAFGVRDVQNRLRVRELPQAPARTSGAAANAGRREIGSTSGREMFAASSSATHAGDASARSRLEDPARGSPIGGPSPADAGSPEGARR